MRLFLIHIILALFTCTFSYSQIRAVKPIKTYPTKTKFSVGAGMTRSVLFLTRNIKENNDATGYSAHITYGGTKLLRVTAEYTYYKPINIEPTWYNIKASTIETNAHFIARFDNSNANFYPLVGLSFNHFSGFFTGKNDFMGLTQKYPSNSIVTTNWLGLNIGTGFEYFVGSLSFFADYRMRIGYNDGKDRQLNIMDICIGFGLRYNITVRSGR